MNWFFYMCSDVVGGRLLALWLLFEGSDYYLPPEDFLDCDCSECEGFLRSYLLKWSFSVEYGLASPSGEPFFYVERFTRF